MVFINQDKKRMAATALIGTSLLYAFPYTQPMVKPFLDYVVIGVPVIAIIVGGAAVGTFLAYKRQL